MMPSIRIFDLHSDVLTGARSPRTAMRKFPVGSSVVCVVFRGEMNIFQALSLFDKYFSHSAKKGDKACIGRLNSFGQTLSECYSAFEDVGYAENCIDAIIARKPLYCSLTWNGENCLGYGCSAENIGLKPRGKEVIASLNSAGIAVDLSHLSERGCYDCIESAERVLISHACINEVTTHPRNVGGGVISEVIARGGIFGLTLVPAFLSKGENASINDVLRHIDYFCSTFGAESLALGSDFFGSKKNVKGLKDYKSLYKLVEKLENLGYNDRVINDIFYLNASRYFGL